MKNRNSNSVPFFQGVEQLIADGFVPGGTRANADFLNNWISYHPEISEIMKILLCDAQTSGGLLIAVPKSRCEPLLQKLEENGVETRAVIGEVHEGRSGIINIVAQ